MQKEESPKSMAQRRVYGGAKGRRKKPSASRQNGIWLVACASPYKTHSCLEYDQYELVALSFIETGQKAGQDGGNIPDKQAEPTH
uniref:Uncharacterized protein n=1 Tax=Thermosporothrix sp. COM3 TaxID=2490863 RepID=A0A455SHS6_9CHLR|nr:hypothetical protein KTC_20470 [Thermosporothrix sp. COM3]